MTYQAASGAGAQKMTELIEQMGCIHAIQANAALGDSILEIEKNITQSMQSADQFPQSEFTVPLAGSLIPWIDSEAAAGLSKEEWEG
jgi:aspartate-semialdehyde dehydrogenase